MLLNVTTPEEAVLVRVPPRVPVPVLKDKVTVVELLALMRLPLLSRSCAVNVVIAELLLAV